MTLDEEFLKFWKESWRVVLFISFVIITCAHLLISTAGAANERSRERALFEKSLECECDYKHLFKARYKAMMEGKDELD